MLENKKETILELETRRKIYELVKKYSGCHFREIERKSGMPHGTLKYHLNYLTKYGLIFSKKENKTERYFPKEFEYNNIKLLSILRQKTLRSIILLIVSNENCHHDEIAEFVKLSQSTVSWHIKKLIKEGVIESKRPGRNTKYKLIADKNEIMALLVAYKESFLDSLVNKTIEMWDLG